MRPLASADRIAALLSALGREASEPTALYLTGGATAVLSQALAKVERGHDRDLADVDAMIARGLIDPATALAYLAEIEPQLFRFPAIDPAEFRRRAEEVFGKRRSGS